MVDNWDKPIGKSTVVTFGEPDSAYGLNEPFIGFYMSKRTQDDKFNPGEQKEVFTFKTKAGETVDIYAPIWLRNELNKRSLGYLTKITFTGFSTPDKGKKAAKMFEVVQDKNQEIAVDVPPVSFRGTDEDDVDTGARPKFGATTTTATTAADRAAKMNALHGKR